jgi:hypothetical protein
MPRDTWTCPHCKVMLRSADDLAPGTLVLCPRCRTEFPVPDLTAAPAGAPAPDATVPWQPAKTTPAWPDGPREEQQRSWEEDEDYPRPPSGQPADLGAPCEVDVGRCFALASAHWNALAGPACGYLVLAALIYAPVAVIPCVSTFGAILLWPPLQAGVTVVALMQLRGERWSFSDFFGGFRYWGEIVVSQLLVLLILVPFLVPAGVLAGLLDEAGRAGNAVWVVTTLAGLLSLGVALGYVLLRTLFFALPLMIDRGYKAGKAIRGSWTLSRRHSARLFGLALLLLLLNLGGVLLCGVGLLFTYPFTVLVQCAGYLLIAGTRVPLEARVAWRDED